MLEKIQRPPIIASGPQLMILIIKPPLLQRMAARITKRIALRLSEGVSI